MNRISTERFPLWFRNAGARRIVGSQVREEFKHFIHHGVSMILRLATANENQWNGRARLRPCRTSIRSGRNLARGERLLRTPGTRAYVTNAPSAAARGAGSLPPDATGSLLDSLFSAIEGLTTVKTVRIIRDYLDL